MLTQLAAKANPYVIQGAYIICKHLAHILIDTGSSNSFISHVFTQCLNIPPKHFDSILLVSAPTNETFLGNVIYKSYIIEIVDRELSVDLIELDTRYFDVILRIN